MVLIIWIYNYLCNQCRSPLKLWVRIPLSRGILYTTVCDLSLTCDRSVVFSMYYSFMHQSIWPPRYSWIIVESGIKHHKPAYIWKLKKSTHSSSTSVYTFIGSDHLCCLPTRSYSHLNYWKHKIKDEIQWIVLGVLLHNCIVLKSA